MSVGLIIYAVMVAIHGLLFFVGATLVAVFLIKKQKEKSDNLYITALILWAISPLFSIIGVFFGVFL